MIISSKFNTYDSIFEIQIYPEDTPVQGNAISSDDPEFDEKIENDILKDLEINPWAWCSVVVKCKLGPFVGWDSLGCCSYKNEDDFMNCGYYQDMRVEALNDLIVRAKSMGCEIQK